MELEKKLEKWDFVIYDKGYVDYERYEALNGKWIFFVTRPRCNMDYVVIESKNIGINWVQTDQIIEVFNPQSKKTYRWRLRLIHYISPDDWNEYLFLTNNFEINPKLIAILYKKRRQIEIFFKFIKQTLKIKSFLWTSENAVKNQLWVAMIYYLILCYIKFKTNVKQWLLELSRLFSAWLIIRRKIIDLLGLTPQNLKKITQYARWWPIVQLSLF
jgi:IS4 transposase